MKDWINLVPSAGVRAAPCQGGDTLGILHVLSALRRCSDRK